MKKLLITIFLMSAIWCNAQNRVATLLDVAKYGTYITEGDLIIDRPTNGVPFADGINQLRYTTISKSFPGFKEYGTIWIDGSKIGKLCEIRFLNGTETTPWHVSYVSIKPIPGTQVNGVYTKNSYGGFLYLIQGVKHLKVDGVSEAYTGLSNLQKGDFLSGRFGFTGTSTGIFTGYHVFSISVLPGGSFDFSGFEGEHAFSVLRFQGGKYDGGVIKLKVRNGYIHDTESEGMYIGATATYPYSRIEADISDVIIARSGSEGLQFQHLAGNSWVRSITMFSPDCGYLNQFQPGQDTGMQLNPDGGNTVIEKIVIDSWGSHGINAFGSDYLSTVKTTTVKNILLNNGRGEAFYIHPSCKYGMNWTLDSLFIRALNGEYYINSKTAKPNWIISTNNGTDQFTIGTNFYLNLPDVEYVNSGFHEPANKIKFYRKYYAKYITGLDTVRVQYKKGDIIIDRTPGSKPVFTKAINDFTATNTTPRNDKINCIVLTWDTNTVRSDQSTWNKSLPQFNYPPDDLRVRRDNYYGKLNIGFVEEGLTYEELLTIKKELEQTVEGQKALLDQFANENTVLSKTVTDLRQKVDAIKELINQ